MKITKYSTIEDLIKLIKGNNSYQICIIIVMFTLGFVSDFSFNEMPLLETLPIIYYKENNRTIQTQLNYTICTEQPEFKINITETKTHSWVYEYEFYCNKVLVSMLGWTMVGGSFIGTLFSQSSNFYGTRKIMIVGGLLFSLGTLILVFDSRSSLFIGNTILGISNGLIFMTKNIILTEISDHKTRSYLLGISLGGSSLVTIIAYAFVDNNINWRYYYYFNGCICFIMTLFYYWFSVENPCFYAIYRDFQMFKKSLIHIKGFNKVKEISNEDTYSNIESGSSNNRDASREIDLNKDYEANNNRSSEINVEIDISGLDKNNFDDLMKTVFVRVVKKMMIEEKIIVSEVDLNYFNPDQINNDMKHKSDSVDSGEYLNGEHKNSEKEITNNENKVEHKKDITLDQHLNPVFNNNDKENITNTLITKNEHDNKSNINKDMGEKVNKEITEFNNEDTRKVESTSSSEYLDNLINESSVFKPYKSEGLCKEIYLFISLSLRKINTKVFYIFALIISLEESFLYLTSLEVKQYNNEMSSVFYVFAVINLFTIIIITRLMNVKVLGRKGVLYLLALSILITIVIKKLYLMFDDDIWVLICFYLVKRNFIWNLLCPVHTFANESFSSKKRILFYGLGYSISKAFTQLMPFIYEFFIDYIDFLGIIISIILIVSVIFTAETLGKKL